MGSIFDNPEARRKFDDECEKIDDVMINQIDTKRFFMDYEGNITQSTKARRQRAEARLIKLLTQDLSGPAADL